jgi:GNAT superfamily N-acetyltransferase
MSPPADRSDRDGHYAERRMEVSDIPAGLRLCRASGWNQVEADWRLYLAQNPGGCSVIEHGGTVVGTVVTADYQGRMSWIAMVLVHPAHRRRGLGTRLLHLAVEHLRGCETLKLDATPAGREVYLPLGFVDEYPLQRLQTEARPVAAPAGAAGLAPLAAEHVPAVLALDREVFGADRAHLLRDYLRTAPEYAQVCLQGGAVTGFSLGRHGHDREQIGPVIARRGEDARALVAAVLTRFAGTPFLLDALLFDPAWLDWLQAAGFQPQRPYTRMYKGPNRYPGRPERQYAILGPELG